MTAVGARPWVTLFAAEALVVVAFLAVPRALSVTGLTLVTGGALLVAAHFVLPAREREPVLLLTGVALLLRLTALALVHHYRTSAVNPAGFLFPDSFGYDQVGEALAEHWRRGIPPRLEYQTAGYTIGYHYLVGGIYRLVGHVPLVVSMLNVLLSTSMVPMTFVLGRRLAGAQAGLTAAGLIAVWPPLVLWSTQLLKDTTIVFLLLAASLAWTSFAARPRLVNLVGTILPVLPLIFIRTYMFLFWMIGLACGLAALALSRRKPLIATLLAVAVLVFGLLGALEYSALRFRSIEVWLGRIDAAGTGSLEGSLFENVRYRSLRDLCIFFPMGLVRFVVTPIPWKTELLYWHEALGSVSRYALVPFAVVGGALLFRKKRLLVLPIFVTLGLAAALYAAAFRGGGPRHLTQFYPLFLVCAATGLPRFPNWPLPLALGVGGFLVAGGLLALR